MDSAIPNRFKGARLVRALLLWVAASHCGSPLVQPVSALTYSSDPLELDHKILQAVERGVKWLESRQRRDGAFVESYAFRYPLGETALASLALAACSPSSRALPPAMAFLRRTYSDIESDGGLGLTTYGVSLCIMAAVESQERFDPVRGSETKNGSSRTSTIVRLSPSDTKWITAMTRWLVKWRNHKSGAWRYPRPESEYDHSNTQFAILALRSARRCGIDVSARIFYDVLQHFLETQHVDEPKKNSPSDRLDLNGGFGYEPGAAPIGSMTAAGVVCLSICREQTLGRHPRYTPIVERKTTAAIAEGLDWLGRTFAVDHVPDPTASLSKESAAQFHFYYLYTLERACGLASVRDLNGRNWYREGVEYLLRHQAQNGRFQRAPGKEVKPSSQSLIDTCFALLFLSRLSDPKSRLITPSRRLDLSGAAQLTDSAFNRVFSKAFLSYQADGQEGLAAAEFRKMGTRIYSSLVDKLTSTDGSERAAALNILEKLTGSTLGYSPNNPLADRNRCIEQWRIYIGFLE